MNPNEETKPPGKTVWPGARTAGRRLLRITLILFPLSLVVFALLVKDWRLNLPEGTEESRRHLWEWLVVLVTAISVTFLAGLLPSLHRFFSRLSSGRNVRRMLILLAWMMTMVALFYAEEDWRSWHAWNNYRQQLEAGGAQLDLAAFIPATVPDEQNFAATPFVKSWFVRTTNQLTGERIYPDQWQDNFAPALGRISKTKEGADRHFMDLVAWEMAFDAIQSGRTNSDQKSESGRLDLTSRTAAVPLVLAGLATNEMVFAELRNATQRPYSRYPVVYDLDNPWGILLPHLRNVKQICLRLQLKACAELAAGRNDDALADVTLMLDLADSVRSEPFLISYLVRIACVQIAIQPVWEGLAEHRWSDAQLQAIQTRFQRYNFVADMEEPFDSERAAGILTADLVAGGKYHLNDLAGDPNQLGWTPANLFGRIVPRGWYRLEQLSYGRLFQLQLEGAFEGNKKMVYPARLELNSKAMDQAFAGRNPVTTICIRHQLMAVMLLPALNKVPVKAAMAQTAVDEAILACALERFRLVNGQFPKNLATLGPFVSPLPNDVISGEPYKYRRTEDGQFVLYSVGWNEKDDGGVPGKTLFDEKEGDWVWQYPGA